MPSRSRSAVGDLHRLRSSRYSFFSFDSFVNLLGLKSSWRGIFVSSWSSISMIYLFFSSLIPAKGLAGKFDFDLRNLILESFLQEGDIYASLSKSSKLVCPFKLLLLLDPFSTGPYFEFWIS